MLKARSALIFLLMGLFLISGCAGLVIGGVAAGAASGTYFWVNGEMTTDYHDNLDKVWLAAGKTIADMKGMEVLPDKEIAQGTISALINDEKVVMTIKYKEKNVTTVSIRVGLIGDKLASQRLHDKITENLAKM
jgi:hypothetical protein